MHGKNAALAPHPTAQLLLGNGGTMKAHWEEMAKFLASSAKCLLTEAERVFKCFVVRRTEKQQGEGWLNINPLGKGNYLET